MTSNNDHWVPKVIHWNGTGRYHISIPVPVGGSSVGWRLDSQDSIGRFLVGPMESVVCVVENGYFAADRVSVMDGRTGWRARTGGR